MVPKFHFLVLPGFTLRGSGGGTEYAAPLGLRLFLVFGTTNISRPWLWGWAELRPNEVRSSSAIGFTWLYHV
jgi:hypothetical protein